MSATGSRVSTGGPRPPAGEHTTDNGREDVPVQFGPVPVSGMESADGMAKSENGIPFGIGVGRLRCAVI
jgi:hypothetical protein